MLDPGTLLVLGKAAGFALLVRAWLVARRVAREAREARAVEAAPRDGAAPAPTAWRDAA
ncbi:MAG: hypothetical protein ACFBWO_08535 [Paracoccaceae bacterium]